MTGLTSILNILALLGWLAAAGGVFLAISAASRRASARPGILLTLVGAVAGLVFSTIGAGLIIIEAQQTGVIFRVVGGDADSLVDTPLGPGLHWVVPFIDQVTIYPTELQNVDMTGETSQAIEARTSDGQAVTVDITVIFQIAPDQVNEVHKLLKQNYRTVAVIPFTRDEVRNVIAAMTVEEVYSQRSSLAPDILEALRPKLESKGLTLSDIAVRNVTFSPEFMDAVERKQIAQQDIVRAENEAEAARKAAAGQADAAVTRAEGERDAEVARAEGEAKAILLRAEADAKALALINEQISKNPALVQWRYIDQLSDNVGIIIIPSDSPFLFDLQALTEAMQSAVVPALTETPDATNE
ncbi:MAG: prohibitin family protein [Anaerolineae bacterium]|nr:prohibitin family protein [Anaerolineae bacterium]